MAGKTQATDIRGFQRPALGSKILMGCGCLVAWFSWKLGLCLLLFGFYLQKVVENVTRPPPNTPAHFLRFSKPESPILICIGDSLTHATGSADYTQAILTRLRKELGWVAKSSEKEQDIYKDPLWIVNAGQNSVTTYTVLKEKLDVISLCEPDYVLVLLGTNDIRSIYKPNWGEDLKTEFDLPELPSWENFEQNLDDIIKNLVDQTYANIGICTLPPLGEDLSSPANQLVAKANRIISEKVEKQKERCTLVPVNERLKEAIKKHPSKKKYPVDKFEGFIALMFPLHCFFGVSWNAMSSLVGNCVLSDTLHLNEDGAAIVANTVVEWLKGTNIQQVIEAVFEN